ncbi:MAG TPA: DNA gyrase subunit A [Acidimicrobiales bacterium]|jgi:DNA gyrase subunit A|nr:DNA gyrase subunit A [Acidimicrobiales bacterium]
MSDQTPLFGIEPIELQEEMEQSFLVYALAMITQRALPDVRDGLKPVHRRILYDMFEQGFRPDRPHVKCARVTGDVMAKYHPHGNQAIYDALVRMAQPFSLRHPLIDFHGNYGSPDFEAAAERYCVTGDTLVATPGGDVPIATLAGSPIASDSELDIAVKVLDKFGDPVLATKLFHSGSHPTLRLSTASGQTITGTGNHPLLCLVPVAGVPLLLWKLLEEIRPGDVVVTVQENPYMRYFCTLVDDFAAGERAAGIAGDEIAAAVEPLEAFGYATVESVEPAGVQPVYSIRVDSDCHSFLANGFVNHNTECRLAPLAMQLMAGLNEETVDFADNYSGEFREPVVLPARFPNLLVNGSQGIAVAMATNIPPHNLAEVIDATVHLIDNPAATPDELMAFVKGPDFPTGGYILGRQGIIDAYRTGRGSIKMRAKAEIVEGKRGEEIVVTQLPYQVSVRAVAEKIQELVDSRQLEGIRDIDNLSAKGLTRIVIYLKRDANANVVLNNLYKHTPLQTNFAVNSVALVDGVPRTLNLAQLLGAYVDHQVEVITRRSQFRLDKARARAHIVEGLLKALDMIDLIIETIRASDDKGDARRRLMAEPFEFSEEQAEHILDMTLARLTRLSRQEYEDEMTKLRETITELERILGDPAVLRGVIKSELGEAREKWASPRIAEITFDPGDLDNLDLINDEELVVTMTKAGYIKTVSADAFRPQGRGGRGISGGKLKDNDYVTRILHTTAHAYLLFFSNRGRVYRLRAHEIPMKDRTARGTAIVNLLPLAPGERVQAVIDTRDYETSRFLFFATRRGQVKKTRFTEYDSSLRAGIIAINLKDGDELVRVIQTNEGEDIFMVSRTGMTIRFDEDEVRASGRAAQGVIGMRLRDDDEVVSCDVARPGCDILIITDAGFGKRTKVDRFPKKGRGTLGVKGIRLTARRGYVVSAFMVSPDDEVLLVSSTGITNRQRVGGISAQGRDATGVKIMDLPEGQTVAGVAPVLSTED